MKDYDLALKWLEKIESVEALVLKSLIYLKNDLKVFDSLELLSKAWNLITDTRSKQSTLQYHRAYVQALLKVRKIVTSVNLEYFEKLSSLNGSADCQEILTFKTACKNKAIRSLQKSLQISTDVQDLEIIGESSYLLTAVSDQK